MADLIIDLRIPDTSARSFLTFGEYSLQHTSYTTVNVSLLPVNFLDSIITGVSSGNIEASGMTSVELIDAIQAIASDLTTVHLAGAETITGPKTFSGTTIFTAPIIVQEPVEDLALTGIISLEGDVTFTSTSSITINTDIGIGSGFTQDSDVAAGAADTLPVAPVGYLKILINGQPMLIPYYGNTA